MSLDHVCIKKDKRLLVLLTLSSFILLTDINLFTRYNPVIHDYIWIEKFAGEKKLTLRYELTEHRVDLSGLRLFADNHTVSPQTEKALRNSLKQERAIAVKKEQGGYATVTQVSPRLAFFLGQPFSINTAWNEDFELIPGVGAVLASNIVAYREVAGPITDPAQLENVPGIGPQTKQKLQDYFTYSIDVE